MNQLFYAAKIENGIAFLDDEESRHLLSVLRFKLGERLQIADGQGFIYDCELIEGGKKQAFARIVSSKKISENRPIRLHVAIAPTKQMERFEWFLEKATEIGIDEITPLLCQRSERTVVRIDRLEKILISAMKQSLRATLPKLNHPAQFSTFVKNANEAQKRIAWCDDEPMPHLKSTLQPGKSALFLIGPEGDFSPEEVRLAIENGFMPVSLGASRLRTETAGVLATAIANLL